MVSGKDAHYQLDGLVRHRYTRGVRHERAASRMCGQVSLQLGVLDIQTNISRPRRRQCTYTAGTAAKIENIRAAGRCDPWREFLIDDTYACQALNPIIDVAVRSQTV